MTSDAIRDVVCAAKVVLNESAVSRMIGGMTVQEHSALYKLEKAVTSFLEEVGI